MGWFSLIKLFLALSSVFFAGYVIIYLLILNRYKAAAEYQSFSGRVFIFFISFYAGFFITSNFLILLSIAKIKFDLLYIVIFSAAFFSIFLFIFIRKEIRYKKIISSLDKKLFLKNKNATNSHGYKRSFSFKTNLKSVFAPCCNLIGEKSSRLSNTVFALLVFLISVSFLVVVFFAILFPIRFWDAISCWSLKAKAFFIDGSIMPFYSEHNYYFSHLSYPLYLPLAQTWIYIWLGSIEENLVKIIFPLFYASLIFIFYHLFKKRTGRLPAVFFVFVVSALPVIMDHGYIEYTNLVFSVVLFLGVYFLYRYLSYNCIQDKSLYAEHKSGVFESIGQKLDACNNLLILSAIFFSVLALIRSEGLLFLVLFFTVSTAFSLSKILKIIKDRVGLTEKISPIFITFTPVFLSIFFMLPWFIFKGMLKIPLASSEWLTVFSQIRLENQSIKGVIEIFNIRRAAGALSSELFYSVYDSTQAFLGSSYGVIWAVLAVLLILNFKNLFKSANWIYPVFIAAGFAAVFISIALIGEFAWSADRYVLHLFPLTYFWIFYNLPLFNHGRELAKRNS